MSADTTAQKRRRLMGMRFYKPEAADESDTQADDSAPEYFGDAVTVDEATPQDAAGSAVSPNGGLHAAMARMRRAAPVEPDAVAAEETAAESGDFGAPANDAAFEVSVLEPLAEAEDGGSRALERGKGMRDSVAAATPFTQARLQAEADGESDTTEEGDGTGNALVLRESGPQLAEHHEASELATAYEFNQHGKYTFKGQVLTAENGPMKVVPESRNLCALFDTGLWLVSASHRNSPLVTSVAAQARRSGYRVSPPIYVTPDVIAQAYMYASRTRTSVANDTNAIRRKIVKTLEDARKVGANDIHIECSHGRSKVEFRIEGSLTRYENWTQKEGEMLLSAVWSHASTQSGSTANWLEPQAATLTSGTGADKIQLPDGVLGVRCQWIPLADGGRYLDMRLHYDGLAILGSDTAQVDVDSLGFSQEQTELVSHLRKVPGGMRLICGPVNQGKTTTLRVMLNRRMAETNYALNCLMVEDPPEGGVTGAREIGISAAHQEEQRQRTFQEVMRSALRLDPDIVMLGEVRDSTTATFAFRLALTGRQVYTTLHVYSALAIPQRLRDLGVEPYLCYDHHLLVGLVSQRLVRGLCKHCRIPVVELARKSDDYAEMARRVRMALSVMDWEREHGKDLDWHEGELDEVDLGLVCVANPDGCEHCNRGRKGRTVCVEVAQTDHRLMELLSENRLLDAEAYWLSPRGLRGMTMYWHGLGKVRDGLVSLEDLEQELGPVATVRQVREFEQKMGTVATW